MVIYIHGFGGSGEGSKAKAFREYFKSIGEDFIAPSLSYVPTLAIATLKELIESYHGEVYLIGSSLGGYYATYLSQMPQVKKTLLINPATKPEVTLARALGEAENFYDGSFYSWKQEHLQMIQKYRISNKLYFVTKQNQMMLMVQKGDELLNYEDALQHYEPLIHKVIEEGGSHSFDAIERYFEQIRSFFALSQNRANKELS